MNRSKSSDIQVCALRWRLGATALACCILVGCGISDQSGGGSVVPTGSSTLIPDRPGEDSAALARLALDFATVNGDTSPGSTQYLRGSRNSFAEKLGLLLFAIDREVYIVWIQGNFRPALTESGGPTVASSMWFFAGVPDLEPSESGVDLGDYDLDLLGDWAPL